MSGETTITADMSRCLDQFCTQMSMNNVAVPKHDSCKDIFEFIAEYESATSTLNEDQRRLLLVKAFPVGRSKIWFESELKSLIDEKKPWSTIKTKIIERFSDVEDRDRHLVRLRELKFDPDSNQRLLDFIEDLAYSHKKAYPDLNSNSEEPCVRFIKASIPKSLKASLDMMSDYQSAKNVSQLSKAIKRFDSSRVGSSSSTSSNKLDSNEVMKMFSQIMKGVKESTEKAVVSAIRSMDVEHSNQNNFRPREPDRNYYNRYPYNNYNRDNNSRPNTPPNYNRYERPRTPEGSYYSRRPITPERNTNYGYNRPRDRTPERTYGSSSNNVHHHRRGQEDNRPKSPSNLMERREDKGPQRPPTPNRDPEENFKVFDEKGYIDKHGKPPTACKNCGYWHWIKHCPLN